jgi:hypothetical protein
MDGPLDDELDSIILARRCRSEAVHLINVVEFAV